MIEYCRALSIQIKRAAAGAGIPPLVCYVTYDVLTSHSFTRPPRSKEKLPIVGTAETITIYRGSPILKAVKKGKKLQVVFVRTHTDLVMDHDGFCSVMDGTPFEKLKEPITFGMFAAFAIWMVSAGYFFQKSSAQLTFEEIADLKVKPPLVEYEE
jgi:hypothetical protein